MRRNVFTNNKLFHYFQTIQSTPIEKNLIIFRNKKMKL